MSANDFFLVEDELFQHLYFGIIKTFANSAKSKSTLESAMREESNYMQYLKEMALGDFSSLSVIKEFDQLTLDGYPRNMNYVSKKIIHTSNIILFLEKKYSDFYNEFEVLTSEINGKLKRISQKKSALKLWKDDVSFYHLENFVNTDYINGSLSTGNSLQLNLDQGICLLPVQSKEKVRIKSIRIVSGNGTAGNLDYEVNSSTMLLTNVLDDRTDTAFQYQKLDKGPLNLELRLDFFSKKIVNGVEINPYFMENDSGFEVEEILFFRDKHDSLSLKKLCPLDNFFIQPSNDGKDYIINFLPVECVSMLIRFKQDSYKNTTRARRGVTRDRVSFSIGIRDIHVYSSKYSKSGEISSSRVPLPVSSFIGRAEIDLFPKSKDLYSFSLLGNFQKQWSEIIFKDKEKKSESFLLDGNESSFGWKLYLEKKESEFKTKSSYEESLSKLLYVKKYVNKKANISNLVYEGEVKDGNLSVFAETGLRRTLSNKKYKTLKLIKTDSIKFNFMLNGNPAIPGTEIIKIELPLSLKKNYIESNEIGISVNNVDYEEVAYEEDLAEYKYFVSYSENSIFFLKDTFPSRGRIRWYLKPEQLRFFQKSDRVYSRFKFNFDPNKNNIKIVMLSSVLREKQYSLKNGKKSFFLDLEGIDKDSFIIENSGGYIFHSQSDLKSLHTYTSTNDYDIAWYFDERSNIFYIHKEMHTRSNVKLRFKARSRTVLNPEDYEIWDVNSVPVGIYIEKDKFKSELIEEFLYSDLSDHFSNITNTLVSKSKTLDNATVSGTEHFAFELSYPNIIKGSFMVPRNLFLHPYESIIEEVKYIDGTSEFLDLVFVEKEYTNEIQEQLGVVTFTIGAASLFYPELKVVFDDNGEYFDPALDQSSIVNYTVTSTDPLGTWHVSTDGVVQVRIDTGLSLPANIRYSYYYVSLGSEKLQNKYSVDYENSIIYFSDEVKADEKSKIKYRISNYSSEYDILTKVKDYKVNFSNRSVKVSTEEFPLDKGNVYLFYKKNMYSYNLENVVEYFSPLVYSIGFEFR